MTAVAEFAARVRARYPEGLTCVLSLGGTRTTYILSERRGSANPGEIESFSAYAAHLLERYQEVMGHFFDLGGQNLIIPPLSIHNFSRRGAEYRDQAAKSVDLLFSGDFIAFYERYEVDPYFTGIDALLHMRHVPTLYQLGERIAAFQRDWQYCEGRRRVVWEIGAVPLFSLTRLNASMSEYDRAQLEQELASVENMEQIYEILYAYYARALYGTDIPQPHLYIGSSRNGDFKLRIQTPLALENGGQMRLFYTPYPNTFLTLEGMRAIIEDLEIETALDGSDQYDYSGKLTPELVEAEYQRVEALRADSAAILGLRRKVSL
ncbi:MAG: hypothetical protein CUN53_06510 [Phototrophicales bacterium]|nr:MAG: hypothetical protein CUN53_06510 [Phototrophicales bacterium]